MTFSATKNSDGHATKTWSYVEKTKHICRKTQPRLGKCSDCKEHQYQRKKILKKVAKLEVTPQRRSREKVLHQAQEGLRKKEQAKL